ncbi:unnamed protein product [Oppiella nova]|uniref:Sushi domain-containing protein n=1 Tax=Oppiella nova TaxID=334625 RepID=A0A7R9QVU1_9ACAR|nr:unnamed protein product [Oppiella nova]CAG2175845.1 unnamed protein product [Oppiella nova]
MSVKNAYIFDTNKWYAIEGTSVSFRCKPGFEFVTDPFRTCLDNSKWDQTAPINHYSLYGTMKYNENNMACVISPDNIQLDNQTLALTVRPENNTKHNIPDDKPLFSRPELLVNFDWRTTSYLVIRAALPQGQLLYPFVLVRIMVYEMIYGIPIISPIEYIDDWDARQTRTQILNEDLAQFHTYTIEWNDTHYEWSFDYKYSYTNHYNPLNVNSTFIGPRAELITEVKFGINKGDMFVSNDYLKWKCSALIIDYVRLYRRADDNTDLSYDTLHDSTATAPEICKTIMDDIVGKERIFDTVTDIHGYNTNSEKSIVVIISLVLVLTSVSGLIFMYCKHKRLKRINREMVSDVYDDNRLDDYEECDYNIDHKYEEPYDTSGHSNNVDPDGPPIYLEITNTTRI